MQSSKNKIQILENIISKFENEIVTEKKNNRDRGVVYTPTNCGLYGIKHF